MAGQESLRAAGARDKNFVGVDIDAMARLIQQMGGASGAISAWLRTNGALPPSVPRTGLREAAAVDTWVGAQSGMLTRRRNYAVTHLDQGGPAMPQVSPGGLGGAPHRRRTTAAGAGPTVGHFPDTHAALRAGAADAAAFGKDHDAAIWHRLDANAGDPDYTHGLYARLGPAGTADLIKAAGDDQDRLAAVRRSLGVASHHLTIDEKWLRAMLARAGHDGVRDEAVRLLAGAGLGPRAKVALGHLGLTELLAYHETVLLPIAHDPHAAAEVRARDPEALRDALAAHPRSRALRLIAQDTA